MDFLAIWECRCGHETLLLPESLPEITTTPRGPQKVDLFLDFVCPQCGLGTRRSLRDIHQRQFQNLDRYKPFLFHAFLRCAEASCSGRGVVHTLAESGSPSASPKIAVNLWKFEGIDCHEGHTLKEPSQLSDLKGWTVTA